MKIIAIEGLDKSGKHTVSNLIVQHLEDKGFKVAKGEFHRYDTPIGEYIRQYLTEEIDFSKETIEILAASDKAMYQLEIQQLEKEGYEYLILDRYILSQIVYGMANGFQKSWLQSITDHLRKPDYEIILEISPETSMSRKGKHNNGENDRYESDFELLTKVADNYKKNKTSILNPSYIDAEEDMDSVKEKTITLINEILSLDNHE